MLSKSTAWVTAIKSVITFEALELVSIASKSTACVKVIKSVITFEALELVSIASKSTAWLTERWSTFSTFAKNALSNLSCEIEPTPIAVTLSTALKEISSVPTTGIDSLSTTKVLPI